jgi:hypothetical protein
MPEYRYCRDREGRIWAIEITDKRVTRAAGPIAAEDATPEMLPHFPYDARSSCLLDCPDADACPYKRSV